MELLCKQWLVQFNFIYIASVTFRIVSCWSTETLATSKQQLQVKIPYNSRKPQAGPDSYGRVLLMAPVVCTNSLILYCTFLCSQ